MTCRVCGADVAVEPADDPDLLRPLRFTASTCQTIAYIAASNEPSGFIPARCGKCVEVASQRAARAAVDRARAECAREVITGTAARNEFNQ